MNKVEFSEKLAKQLSEIKISITEDKTEKFYFYMKLLLEWNEKINLTAIIEPEEIITKHFIDSLTILPEIPLNSKVIDIGTGAGFPGIPLKIIREDIDILLLDCLNKRIDFLNEIINKLKLKKIQAIHSRAEDAGKLVQYREKFNIATSRAVANMNILAEYLLPFVTLGGKAIFMKGSHIEEEIKKSSLAISMLGGEINKIQTINLPRNRYKKKYYCSNQKKFYIFSIS